MDISFMLLFVGIEVVLFVWVISMLRKVFTRNVVTATRHLEGLSQDFDQRKQDVKSMLEDAERTYNERVVQAEDDANQNKAKIINEAKEEAEKIVQKARQEAQEIMQQADKASKKMTLEIEGQLKSRAIKEAVKLLSMALPDDAKELVHLHLVHDLVRNGIESLQIPGVLEEFPEIKVSTAIVLKEGDKLLLRGKIKDKIGKDLDIGENIDKELVAGLVVSLGSLVIDVSLKYKIQQALGII